MSKKSTTKNFLVTTAFIQIALVIGMIPVYVHANAPRNENPEHGLVGSIVSGGQRSTHNTVTINVQSFAFSPTSVTINVGDTITWQDHDSAGHTIVSTGSPSFTGSGGSFNGSTYSYTFNSAGTYQYRCGPHSSMTGTITVQGSAPTNTPTPTPTATPTPTPTPTAPPSSGTTNTPTPTPTKIPGTTLTVTSTASKTPTPTGKATGTPTPTSTLIPSTTTTPTTTPDVFTAQTTITPTPEISATPTPPSKYTFRLKVTDAKGNPIANKDVTLDTGARTVTDKDGYASFDNVEPGTHTVQVGHGKTLETSQILVGGTNAIFETAFQSAKASEGSNWTLPLLIAVPILLAGGGVAFIKVREKKLHDLNTKRHLNMDNPGKTVLQPQPGNTPVTPTVTVTPLDSNRIEDPGTPSV